MSTPSTAATKSKSTTAATKSKSTITSETIIDKNKYIICYTDGSASKNGNRNAVGGYACLFPDFLDYNVEKIIKTNVTNNRAEYLAAIDAISQFLIINEINNTNKQLIIYSDSMLLVNTMNDWMHKWKKNGWKRSGNKPVENLDLVEILYSLYNDLNVKFIWVKAHSKNNDYHSIMNSKVDEMSRCYMKKNT